MHAALFSRECEREGGTIRAYLHHWFKITPLGVAWIKKLAAQQQCRAPFLINQGRSIIALDSVAPNWFKGQCPHPRLAAHAATANNATWLQPYGARQQLGRAQTTYCRRRTSHALSVRYQMTPGKTAVQHNTEAGILLSHITGREMLLREMCHTWKATEQRKHKNDNMSNTGWENTSKWALLVLNTWTLTEYFLLILYTPKGIQTKNYTLSGDDEIPCWILYLHYFCGSEFVNICCSRCKIFWFEPR